MLRKWRPSRKACLASSNIPRRRDIERIHRRNLTFVSWNLKCGRFYGEDSIGGYAENTTFRRDCIIIYGEPLVLPCDSASLETGKVLLAK